MVVLRRGSDVGDLGWYGADQRVLRNQRLRDCVIFEREQLDGFYRYCVALAGDEDGAWDLLQSSYERFLAARRGPLNDPRAYFYRVIRNQFLDGLKHDRVRRVADGFVDAYGAVTPLEEASLEEILLRRDEVERLLAGLAPADRELLFLAAVEGLTAAEIAARLEKSRGTILSRICRLKAKLRAILNSWDENDGRERQGSR